MMQITIEQKILKEGDKNSSQVTGYLVNAGKAKFAIIPESNSDRSTIQPACIQVVSDDKNLNKFFSEHVRCVEFNLFKGGFLIDQEGVEIVAPNLGISPDHVAQIRYSGVIRWVAGITVVYKPGLSSETVQQNNAAILTVLEREDMIPAGICDHLISKDIVKNFSPSGIEGTTEVRQANRPASG